MLENIAKKTAKEIISEKCFVSFVTVAQLIYTRLSVGRFHLVLNSWCCIDVLLADCDSCQGENSLKFSC